MNRKALISASLVMAIFISLLGGFATIASATTVTDLSDFIVDSKVPTAVSIWCRGSSNTPEDSGVNNTRTVLCTGTATSDSQHQVSFSNTLPKWGVNENTSVPYILHLSYRIQNDRTNPATIRHRMQYTDSNNNGKFNDLFDTSDSAFTMNLDTSKNISSFNTSAYNYLDPYDYKVDLYENLKTGAYQIYLNGVKWTGVYDDDNGRLFSRSSASGAHKINEYRLLVTAKAGDSWSFKIVNPCYEIYSQDVLMDEIIAATVSGMSNYPNITTANTAASTGLAKQGNIVLSGITGGYSATATSAMTQQSTGHFIVWWNSDNKANIGSSATDKNKAWMHIGYNISNGTSGLALHMDLNYYPQTGNKKTTTVIPAHTGTEYRSDFYYDLDAGKIYVYYNGLYDSCETLSLSSPKVIDQIRVGDSSNSSYSFNITNIVFEYYPDGVTPSDMIIGYDARTKVAHDYIYQIDGIKSGTNVIGKMGGVCTVTGDNSSGYTLTPDSINGSNGGFARYTLNYTENTCIYQSDDDKVLWHTVYYKPQTVSNNSKHQIGVRGGTGSGGYKWFLNAENGAFYVDGTNKYIKAYNSSTFYRIDFILNNKDYKYYMLLDGVCIDSGTLYWAPIWQIAYTQWNRSDRMVLKNMQTTLYKNDKAIKDVVTPKLTQVYANVESVSVSGSDATVASSFIGPTSGAGANTKILYGIYDSSDSLLKYDVTDGASGYINGTDASKVISVPTGGTKVKVFMWNLTTNSIQALSNAASKSLQ